MKRTLAFMLVGLLASSGHVAAQGEPRFRSGAISWTPTLTLRDAGVDSNVYDEATNPKRDTSAVLAPHVEGLLGLTAADVRFSGGADFVYFHRYAAERSANTRGDVQAELRAWRVRPFGRVAYLDSRERVNSEIDVRARRRDHELGGGAAVQLTPRGSVEVGATLGTSSFRQGQTFRGVDLARRLNRESVTGSVRVLYELTPLTRIVGEGSAARDRFTLSPAYDSRNLRAQIGVEFHPDAVVKGRAKVGFHRLEPVGELAMGFEGLTAALEVGYVLLQRTRMDVRLSRDASYSFETQPFFLQTIWGGRILHTVFDQVEVFADASRETLDYPGIPERLIPMDTLNVTKYGGGVAFRPAQRVRLSLTYERTDRGARLVRERSYDRQRVFTTITYGF